MHRLECWWFVFCKLSRAIIVFIKVLTVLPRSDVYGKKSELFPSASLSAKILYLRSAFLSLNWIQYKFCLVNRKLIYRTAENDDNLHSLTISGGLWKWWSVRIKWDWQSHSKLFWLHRAGASMVVTNITVSSIHWNLSKNTAFELEKIMPEWILTSTLSLPQKFIIQCWEFVDMYNWLPFLMQFISNWFWRKKFPYLIKMFQCIEDYFKRQHYNSTVNFSCSLYFLLFEKQIFWIILKWQFFFFFSEKWGLSLGATF